MSEKLNYGLKRDSEHGCPVPWGQSAAYEQHHWQCPECGRWWHRTWELGSDQPPVSELQLLRRAGAIAGSPVPVHRHRRVAGTAGGLDYLLWVPDGSPGPGGWPLIVFLHGGAETGGDLSNTARGGLPHRIENGMSLPSVVLSPHCPAPPHPNRQSWLEFQTELDATVSQVREHYPVDPSAILLTGQSMGGFGTWHLAASSATNFTALAPVSGGGDPRQVARLAQIPICVFHSRRDTVVPVQRAFEMIDAIRGLDGQVRTVIYPDASHGDTAERAYEPKSPLYEWFESTHAR